MTTDNNDQIRRAQGGDREAFARIVDAHYERMYRIASHYCGNRQDAEDITQQACIKLARSIQQFRFEARFSTWLYRLVVNCCRDYYKAQKPNHELLDTDDVVTLKADHIILLQQVLSKVDSMGEGFRETLSLVIGEGLTHAQAADILAVKESTVSWRLHEIRKRLNVELQLEGKA